MRESRLICMHTLCRCQSERALQAVEGANWHCGGLNALDNAHGVHSSALRMYVRLSDDSCTLMGSVNVELISLPAH